MKSHAVLKNKAVQLRQQGKTYSEILTEISVAKSTLSEWLKSVGLSKQQQQRITQKKIDSALRGAMQKRKKRIALVEKIHTESQKEIGGISQRELWFFGIALYWAEGSKEKEAHPGSGIKFTNSDPHMIRVFLQWLVTICHTSKDEIRFEIIIHENSKNSLPVVINHWSRATGFPTTSFPKIYFKKSNPKIHRNNVGINYFGVLTIKVCKSSTLNRKIAGWVKGVIESTKNCGVVQW